jgi:hypothetical protein
VLGFQGDRLGRTEPGLEHEAHEQIVPVWSKIAPVRLVQKAFSFRFGEDLGQGIGASHGTAGIEAKDGDCYAFPSFRNAFTW